MTRVTDRQTTITASGITAGGRTHNTEQPHEGVRMLTTEETTHHTTTTGTFDAASRLCTAWQWLETQRQTALEGADVWGIRWQVKKSATYLTDLLHTLQAGEYRLSPLQLHGQGSDRKAVWGAQDALVLKWVALSIEGQLPLHPVCEHVKGHGGGRQSVNRLHALLTGTPPEQTDTTPPKKTAGYAWVCRTDIRGYYRNISKETLLNQVRQHVQDAVLTALINQYIHYSVEDGGTFHTPEKGISRGCALSPLMGALHLYDMDEHFSRQKDIHYARYMDDIVILAKSRWSLRKHTKRLMQWFSDYGFEAHPDKTKIGRTKKGFDWMGAWLTDEGVTDIAPRAKANHREKVRRLYERLARVPTWLRHRRQQQVHARVSTYRNRWNIWAASLTIITLGVSLCSTSSATGLNYDNLPTTIPADTKAGDVISTNGHAYGKTQSPITFSSNPSGWSFKAVGMSNNQSAASPRLVKGVATFAVFANCPSLGIQITGGSASRGGSLYIGPSIRGWGTLAGAVPGNAQTTVTVTFNLNYVALTDASNWVCVDLQDANYTPVLQIGDDKQPTGPIETTINSVSVLIWNADKPTLVYNLNKGGGGKDPGTVKPPVVPAACSFTSTDQNINFPNAITPAQINAVANSKVIAKAPSSISLSITCSGNMTGVQPVVELAWTKSASLGGSNGLRIGVANDVDDTSNGILLSTTDAAVGAYGDCGTVPKGYDMCGAYPINPATGLTLYPVLFRNTFNTGNAKSGVHTVTGTLKVVVP